MTPGLAVPVATPAASFATALWRRRWAIGFVVALTLGAVFRLIWLADMEYKSDEAWTFAHVQSFWQSHALAWTGMNSSAGLPNAGLSLWLFIALGAFLPSGDPLALARAVQLINVAAILLLALFAYRRVERSEREAWLWATALVAVNPLAVLFSRKIWPPELLPLFTVAMLAAWWQRERWWGAFCWGLVGMLLGQIQLAGFFFAASFVACSALFARSSVRWSGFLCGSVLGALPALPWLLAVAASHDGMSQAALGNLVTSFFADWFSLALGLDLPYALGGDFGHFLAEPFYLAAGLLAAIVAIFAILVYRFCRRLMLAPKPTLARLFDKSSPTALVLIAAFLGFGVLLAATLRPFYLHYLIVAFALPALSLAWIARAGSREAPGSIALGRVLLALLVLAQAGVTLLFLGFIHDTQVIAGDYGTAYRAQGIERAP